MKALRSVSAFTHIRSVSRTCGIVWEYAADGLAEPVLGGAVLKPSSNVDAPGILLVDACHLVEERAKEATGDLPPGGAPRFPQWGLRTPRRSLLGNRNRSVRFNNDR